MSERILSNRYKLESEIGRGGMGVVYRAEDMQVKRTVAIKTLPAVMTHNQELMKRFNAEVQNASRLEHPNIARVFDVGEDGGTHYYVMQYIDGSDLRVELNKQGRFSVDETIRIISQVAGALDYAHSQGIVHRDIKPENILLDKEGNAHVVDFGIAKATEGTRTTRGMLGTPEYMSPEQVKGKNVDGRSDQYSLATVAYEMLTGRTPFKTEGDDPWAQINMHLNTPVPNPKTTVPDLPTYVANALLQALAKKPEQRFASCVEFAAVLGGDILVKVSSSIPIYKQKKAFWTVGILSGLALLTLVVLLTISHKHIGSMPTSSHATGHVEKLVSYIAVLGADAIYIVPPDGSEKPKRLCWLPANANDVHLSPNGKWVYFSTVDDKNVYAIQKLNIADQTYSTIVRIKGIDDISIQDISTKGDILYTVWHRDRGYHIGPGGETYDIYTIHAESDQSYKPICIEKSIVDYLGWLRNCVFSPDGRLIAYGSGSSLYLCSADGSGKRVVVLSSQGVGGFTFTVDSKFIIFGRSRSNYVHMYLLELAKLTETEITSYKTSNAIAIRIATHPDGKQIAYYVEPFYCEIWGANIRNLKSKLLCSKQGTNNMHSPMHYSFGPDGKYFAFNADKQTTITFSLDTRTGKLRELYNGDCIGWIMSPEISDTKPNKSATSAFVLPKGYNVSDNISADFDGDGKPETAYIAFRERVGDSGSDSFVFIQKSGNILAKLTNNDFLKNVPLNPKGIAGVRCFKACDLTTDGKAELYLHLDIADDGHLGAQVFFVYQLDGNKLHSVLRYYQITDYPDVYIRFPSGHQPAEIYLMSMDSGNNRPPYLLKYLWNRRQYEMRKCVSARYPQPGDDIGKMVKEYAGAKNIIQGSAAGSEPAGNNDH